MADGGVDAIGPVSGATSRTAVNEIQTESESKNEVLGSGSDWATTYLEKHPELIESLEKNNMTIDDFKEMMRKAATQSMMYMNNIIKTFSEVIEDDDKSFRPFNVF